MVIIPGGIRTGPLPNTRLEMLLLSESFSAQSYKLLNGRMHIMFSHSQSMPFCIQRRANILCYSSSDVDLNQFQPWIADAAVNSDSRKYSQLNKNIWKQFTKSSLNIKCYNEGAVFRVVKQCTSETDRHFEAIYRHHLQGWRVSKTRKQLKQV
jgi:hypothetical protein